MSQKTAASVIWGALLCGAIAWALSEHPATPTSSAAKTDAWLEAKPACVFPLAADALPSNNQLLRTALAGGLKLMAIPPPTPHLVESTADVYPSLGSLHIDLSDASEDDAHKPPKLNWHFNPVAGVRVRDFDVIAHPLLVQGAVLHYELSVQDAHLDLAQDRARRPVLLLMQARQGRLNAWARAGDIQTLCLAAARHFASRHGFDVTDISLTLATPTPRSLDAVLDVNLGGAMGGKLHFTGQMDVADDMSATARHLTCSGDGPGGTLISGLLLPGLIFYDGKTKPLIQFPFDSMILRDARFQMDDGLHITAEFSSAPK